MKAETPELWTTRGPVDNSTQEAAFAGVLAGVEVVVLVEDDLLSLLAAAGVLAAAAAGVGALLPERLSVR